MKKLLMTASSIGHLEGFHQPYLRAFKELGWQVQAGCGGAPRSLPWTDDVIRLPFEKRMSAVGNFRACRILRKRMRSENYDLVIAHTSLAAFFTRLATVGLKQRPKMICVVHGYLFGDGIPALRGLVYSAAELLLSPWTDLVLTMNDWDEAWARAHHVGGRIERIHGMGVDPQRLMQPQQAETGFAEGDFVLIYPAEFSKRKSQAVLIRAMTLLPERVKLLLPGNGALLDECRALAEKLGLKERVRFPGRVEDIGGLLRHADVLVSASQSEGLPFCVQEGMLMGLPVVASRVKGHTDLVTEGKNGLLYPYGDEKGFAEAVRKLMEDDALRARMGAAGREMTGPYTLETVLPQVMRAYMSVADDEKN